MNPKLQYTRSKNPNNSWTSPNGRLTCLYKLVYETVRDLEVKWAFSNKQLSTNANKHKSKQAKAVSYHKYTIMSTKQQDDSN